MMIEQYGILGQPLHSTIQWRIQDFPQGGAPIPKIANFFQFFAENCMKMKEFGPGVVPGAPSLDLPMLFTGVLLIQQVHGPG